MTLVWVHLHERLSPAAWYHANTSEFRRIPQNCILLPSHVQTFPEWSPISFLSCFMLPKLRAQFLLSLSLPWTVFQARLSNSRPTKTALKRTSVTLILEFSREQLRVLRTALDSLRLQRLDWGCHTRSSFLAELAGSRDGCHCKGFLEPPCRLWPRERTGLSTNTSSELASGVSRGRQGIALLNSPAWCLLPGGTGPIPMETKQ